jgi:DnaJ family protein B protein 12
MDSSKDEAAKCLRIGKEAIEAGDKQRALRFLSMAKRLYPNPQVDTLISSSYEERGGSSSSSRQPTTDNDMETDGGAGVETCEGRDTEQNGSMSGKKHDQQNGFQDSSGASTAHSDHQKHPEHERL